jgi:hypothetical protein
MTAPMEAEQAEGSAEFAAALEQYRPILDIIEPKGWRADTSYPWFLKCARDPRRPTIHVVPTCDAVAFSLNPAGTCEHGLEDYEGCEDQCVRQLWQDAEEDLDTLEHALVKAGSVLDARRDLPDYEIRSLWARAAIDEDARFPLGKARATVRPASASLKPTDLERAERLPNIHDLPEVTARQIMGQILAAEGDTGYCPGVSLGEVEEVSCIGTGGWCPVHSLGATVCLYGRQNVGKTAWLIDDLVQASAAGKCMVLYCAIDGIADMETRVKAQYEGARERCFDDPLFRLEFISLDFGNRGNGWDELDRRAALWTERFKSIGGTTDGLPLVVVLETLSTALDGGDENGTGTQRFISGATRFAKAGKAAGNPRTFVFTHHGDAKPRGHSSILGNTDRVLRMVARSNGVVSVFVPTGANAKDRFGPQGREFARFKLKTRKLESGRTTVMVVPPPSEERAATAPESCPEDLRAAWQALDKAGASEGIDDGDFNAVLQELVADKKASAEAIRKRRTRLRDQLLAAGVVVEREGVFRLAE